MNESYLIVREKLPVNFTYPKQYGYILGLGLTDFAVWNLMSSSRAEAVIEVLKNNYPDKIYIPFAEQRGSDDIACWINEAPDTVVIVENYSSPGTELMLEYKDLFAWLKTAIDEMIEHISDEIRYS